MVQIEAARKWLNGLPSAEEADPRIEPWDEFALGESPTVTLFGSYDTGKSSLLRRLLVDNRQDVPNWLTISARHETFESNAVKIGPCIVRDTPGFAVDATDARGENNSRRALASIGLTDIGVAVLTPQLATSDREHLAALVNRGWPNGSLWFVISRFDETTDDPEHNTDGYLELAERKVAELRDLFKLDPAVPVFVVSQDPYQTAGSDSDPHHSIWDDFREWDGMRVLEKHLHSVNPQSLPQWREAAAQRYWHQAVTESIEQLEAKLTECESTASVASQGVARRVSWESELAALDGAAVSSLDGLVEEVVNRWWSGHQTSLDELQTEIEKAVTDWFTAHDAQLRKLERAIQKTADRDHSRPAWDNFSALVARLGTGPQPTAPPSGGTYTNLADQVDEAGDHVINIMKVLAEQWDGPATAMKGRGRAGDLNKYVSVAEAALPLALFVAQRIDAQRRANAAIFGGLDAPVVPDPTMKQQVIDDCTREAHTAWKSFVEGTQRLIVAETDDQVALATELGEAAEQLRAAIADGTALLT
ncbi:GTPase domain-containing protein [Gordonia jacobaea]|uniref:GTPase domain-containing protein n=1 Tax=Gordonia jacobaea TaxID=122202 RepID=UPI003D712ABF